MAISDVITTDCIVPLFTMYTFKLSMQRLLLRVWTEACEHIDLYVLLQILQLLRSYGKLKQLHLCPAQSATSLRPAASTASPCLRITVQVQRAAVM